MLRIASRRPWAVLSLIALSVMRPTSSAYGAAEPFSTTLESGETHAGGGISQPSVGTALYTNPAGLADQRENLHVGIFARSTSLDRSPSIGLQATPHWSVLTIGGLYTREASTVSDNYNAFRFGAALEIPQVGLKVGATRYGELRTFETPQSSDFGALWTRGSYRVGAVLITPTSTVRRGYGLGLARELVPGVVALLDVARDDERSDPAENFRHETGFRPGFKVGNSLSEITVSYGTSETRVFGKDWSVGGSFRLFPHTQIEILGRSGGPLRKIALALNFIY